MRPNSEISCKLNALALWSIDWLSAGNSPRKQNVCGWFASLIILLEQWLCYLNRQHYKLRLCTL